MTVLSIVQHPDDRLRARCAPVGEIDEALRDLARDMLETMYAAPGRGLAAPQVGVLLRLFVMDPTWKAGTPDPLVLIDPEIVAHGDSTVVGPEACLSIPGITVDVQRHETVTLSWTDLQGIRQSRTLTGFSAICALHELDHLNGRLCIDLAVQDSP